MNSLKSIIYNRVSIVILLLFCFSISSIAQKTEVPLWKASIHRDGKIVLTKKERHESITLSPTFHLFSRTENPSLSLPLVRHLSYRIPAWQSTIDGTVTNDLFRAATPSAFVVNKVERVGGEIRFIFKPLPEGELNATLQLDSHFPVVKWQFNARKEGYYSILFSPFEASSFEKLKSVWQPLIWQEKRIPDSCYVSAELMCSLPMTVVEQSGITYGISAHPDEVPFRMPTFGNSRFGLLLRNSKGQAAPMIMAPLFGQKDSQIKAGEILQFKTSIISIPGSTTNAYQLVAQQLFDFKDYRRNSFCSLNETLNNMIRFAMDDYHSHWIADLKGSDYTTDVPGTVKNVSALHALSIAYVTDNEEVFRYRALPTVEYMLSREKYLFSIHPGTRGQSPSHYMRGPAAEVSELASLYNYSQGNSPVFSHYAFQLSGITRHLNLAMSSEANSWQNKLALYRITKEKKHLDSASIKALAYIEKRINTIQTDFTDANLIGDLGGQFWTDFAPKWVDLLELYEETDDSRFLQAAKKGAEYYAMYAWMQPSVPDGNITIHKGDKMPMYYVNRNLSPQARPWEVVEQKVPAWSVSNIGLTPEASTTYVQNPGVLLTHYAPYMMRLAQYTGESFFHDIARSAVVGRYCNFPGYDINFEFTNVYQDANYPLHNVNQYTYNQFFFNHVWPMIAMVTDYLVSDVQFKSDSNIFFPSEYAQGYAFLHSKVYGASTGEFYGDKNVRLWLPDNLLKIDNEQINYLSGYGNNKFYLTLTNQSFETQDVTIRLNPDLVFFDENSTYRVQLIQKDGQRIEQVMEKGRLKAKLPPQGIVSLIVEDIAVRVKFQHKIMKNSNIEPEKPIIQETTFGKITGMIMSWGNNLRNAFVYLDATPKELQSAKINYSVDGENRKTITDNNYPFEFSIPLQNQDKHFIFTVSGTDSQGEEHTFSRQEIK